MNTLRKCTLYIAIATVAFACKKEHIQEAPSGSPLFYFSGNVNSQSVKLQAGVSNYYMYSSFAQDSTNIYNYTGTLQQIGCTGCANSIKITINDYKVLAKGASEPNIAAALAAGNYA